jgi:hypothetical protein
MPTKSEIREEFADISRRVYEEQQQESGQPGPVMTISLRADMEMVARVDELAERLNMTRQACILTMLKGGFDDAIGGYLDAFGKDAIHEFEEAVHARLVELREKQMKKFNEEGKA